jgi:hypothetical protein
VAEQAAGRYEQRCWCIYALPANAQAPSLEALSPSSQLAHVRRTECQHKEPIGQHGPDKHAFSPCFALCGLAAGTGVRADILQDFATRMWMQLPPKFDKQKLVRESRLLDPYMLLSLRKLK